MRAACVEIRQQTESNLNVRLRYPTTSECQASRGAWLLLHLRHVAQYRSFTAIKLMCEFLIYHAAVHYSPQLCEIFRRVSFDYDCTLKLKKLLQKRSGELMMIQMYSNMPHPLSKAQWACMPLAISQPRSGGLPGCRHITLWSHLRVYLEVVMFATS
jgi:hypothetical protein